MEITIKENQYLSQGKGKTYYYLVNESGNVWHKDGKFRSKPLIEGSKYRFHSLPEAEKWQNYLNESIAFEFKMRAIEPAKESSKYPEWHKAYFMDAPNKPGYYRANND